MNKRPKGNTELEQSIDEKVHAELLTILYRQSKHMLWAEIFAATLILFILWWPQNSNHLVLIGWFVLMFIASLSRYMLANAFERKQPTGRESYTWEKVIMGMLFLSALVWGFCGTYLMPHDNVLNQALILFLLIGIAATANPFYSPIKKVYAIFLLPTLMLTAITLLMRNTSLNLFLGFAVLLFCVLMLTTAIVSSNLISSALKLHFRNVELTDSLIESNKLLENMATHDTLTGLANRQHFNSILPIAMRNAKSSDSKLGLMYIDIDKFKTINDTLGHDVGDQLIKAVASRLKENFKMHGETYRVGGDEFIAIVQQLNNGDMLTKLAEECCKSIAMPLKIGQHELNVASSIGISVYPDDNVNEDALIKHADIAMYHSKEKGGNCYHFYNNGKCESKYSQ